MKKFFKFVAGVVSLGALACGAYYFCKKYICKETPDEFDDLDDDLDDFDMTDSSSSNDSREYVSINITSEFSDADSLTEDLTEESSKEETTEA
ncbi:hypothetical protein [Lachnoclostridium phytofermentans]|uniref:hypothetical protein n=1 Tax=Lachnoclostridium phytofermentans TaxID=66219 RepID=UPI00049724E7|nr:hypothetical protein [Lachnoclostridium phytofermentans]